jgi:hypothetical protein
MVNNNDEFLIGNEILEIRLNSAILEYNTNVITTKNKLFLQEWLDQYHELFCELKAFLSPLPVPLPVMHTAPICRFYDLYTWGEYTFTEEYLFIEEIEKGLE